MTSTKPIAAPLLSWFAKNRRALPWRTEPRDPYRTWISEVMLQQTRVDVVVPYYERFLKRFPTLRALAEAPLDDVLAHWSGLGYYARARNLHKAARAAGDALPETRDGLQALPGFGPYTSAAVASLAFGEDVALVDGNVARVFARIFKLDGDAKAQSWPLAQAHLPGGRAGEYNEALMELGATVCTPTNARCPDCPLRKLCDGPGDYPRKVAKKPRKLLAWKALALVRDDGAVLLQQRAGESLFGGLWELPREAPEGIVQRGRARACGVVEQALTHRQVTVTVRRAQASGEPASAQFCWSLPSGRAALGLSSLTRKTLALAESR